jgi:hypothetical protein
MNARQRRQDRRRMVRRAEGIHPDAFPAKCPITGRPYFMTLEHPGLGMVPTYGGPYDSFTIPRAEGEASQPWHERELRSERYDHDAGWWVEGGEPIPLRIIHDEVLQDLQWGPTVPHRLLPKAWQGGLNNDDLRAAFKLKLPSVEPTDRDLSMFALGIETGADGVIGLDGAQQHE